MTVIDNYILQSSVDVQAKLWAIHAIICKLAPEVEIRMSYGMPGYYLKGKPLVYFAVYKKHIGLYALPNTHAAFFDELLQYKQGKGSVQFPLNDNIPYYLIERMVQYRIQHLI